MLIVSGGHTEIILMRGHGRYRLLGATLDDVAGEAFDKVARLLGLSYPGGPAVQKAAEGGNPAAFDFPRALTNYATQTEHRFNFSFSGLKTAVLRQVRELASDLDDAPVADLAASFQAAVVDVLVMKTATPPELMVWRAAVSAAGWRLTRRCGRPWLSGCRCPRRSPRSSSAPTTPR